jgi:predicted glycogen debranching enzyme
VYHTADASLWYFHAVARYLAYTDDRHTLKILLPVLEHIVDFHRRGTRFGIKMESDGLLTQGAPGYQLTWMDAKCGDWVVTPRRGKAVEINALWYNALRLLEQWVADDRGASAASELRALGARVHQAFNRRFWSDQQRHLLDVVDGEQGDDPALRPNQLFAISLTHPVLVPERWAPVLQSVERALLTPVGLRSLSPDHPEYKRTYHGDLKTRDAAYHQGTVWSYLIGPYVDAYLKVHAQDPEARAAARKRLTGLVAHLGDAGIGSVSEVFDAEPPYAARGCIAQAWGVAELLRAWCMTRVTAQGGSTGH